MALTRAVLLVLAACGAPFPSDTDVAADTDVEATGCTPGDAEPCVCAGDTSGTHTCLEAPDRWTACGCQDPTSDGEDLYVPDDGEDRFTCKAGALVCAPYRPEDLTFASAQPCCTEDDTCGSESAFIFGSRCVPRATEPTVLSSECPNEFPTYLDLYGCCRSDGACGLSLDQISRWDAGCVERTTMALWLNEGSEIRVNTAIGAGYPADPVVYGAMSCTP